MKKIFQSSLPAILITGLLVSVWGFVLQARAGDEGVTLSTNILAGAISFSTDGNKAIPDITPGTPQTIDSTLTVTTNNEGGYNIKVKRDDATGTLTDSTNYIPDMTDWDGTGPGVVWGTTEALGFRVKVTGTTATHNSTWWGADDTDPVALFAGIPPTTAQTIMNKTDYSATATVTIVQYKCDAPAAQATGTYTGGITYTATVNL